MIDPDAFLKKATRAMLKLAPIDTMNFAAVEKYLGQRVMHQPYAVRAITHCILQAWGHHKKKRPDPASSPPPPPACVVKALLSGPSGSGKTATVEACRHLLGMDPGFANHRFCVFLDASTCKEATAITRIMGSGAGYSGYGDRASLADMLMGVLVSPNQRRLKALALERKAALAQRKPGTRDYTAVATRFDERQAEIEAEEEVTEPPVILLFIDEIDKAHTRVLEALNGLLDKGTISNAHAEEFALPPYTSLLCLFTANYGDKAVATMTSDDEHEAVQLIEADINQRGVQKCTLERFGKIVVYFALSKQQLSEVLMNKLDAYIATTHARIVYADEVKHFLINQVLDTADPERGIRNGVRLLFENLDTLFNQAFSIIDRHTLETPPPKPSEDAAEPVPPPEPMVVDPFHVFIHTFPVDEIEAELSGLMEKIMADAINVKRIARYREHADENHGLVTALGLRKQDEVLAINVMPYNVVVNLVVNVTGRTEERRMRDRERKDGLKGALSDAFQSIDEKDLKGMYKKMALLREEKQCLLEDSSDDEEIATISRVNHQMQCVMNGAAPNKRKRGAERPVITNRVEEILDNTPGSVDETDGEDAVEAASKMCKICHRAKPVHRFEKVKSGTGHCLRNTCRECRIESRKPKK